MIHFDKGPGAGPLGELAQLEAKLAELEAARADLLNKLVTGQRSERDDLELSKTILAGGELPARNTMEQLQADELRWREQIRVLQHAVAKQRQVVELMRARTGAELRRTHPKLESIIADWNKGQALIQEAMQAEDALLSEFAASGYGSLEPTATRAPWINRTAFLNET